MVARTSLRNIKGESLCGKTCLEEEEGAEYGEHGESSDGPSAKPRTCTDCGCCFVFLLFFVLLVHIFNEAREVGNVDKITHGFNWAGEICGVDDDVSDKPFLYWCKSGQSTCVEGCDLDTVACPQTAKIEKHTTDNGGGDSTVQFVVTQKIAQEDFAESTAIFNAYCLPQKDQELAMQALKGTTGGGTAQTLILSMHEVLDSQAFFVVVTIAALIVSYIYLYLMTKIIQPLLYAMFLILFLGLGAGCGLSMAWATVKQEENPFRNYSDSNDQAQRYALYSAAAFAISWLIFIVSACCMRKGISAMVTGVGEAVRCLQEQPTLLLSPLFSVVGKVLVWCWFGYGLALLMSEGKIITTNAMSSAELNGMTAGMIPVTGIQRHFQFTDDVIIRMGIWIFGMFWATAFVDALNMYALSHGCVVWNINSQTSLTPLLKGFRNGLFYHFGTLAFAGFIIASLKFISVVLSAVSKQTKDQDGKQNLVVSSALCCLAGCTGCIEYIMEITNEMVYTDVAIRGDGYLTAVSNVWSLLAAQPAEFAATAVATKVFKVFGVLLVGGGGTWLSYLTLSNKDLINDTIDKYAGKQHIGEEFFTGQILGTTIVSAIICTSVSLSVMIAFDHVADAIVYSNAWRKAKTEAKGYREADE